MTGYASAQHSTASTQHETESKQAAVGHLGLEIRSVNSRFLDLSFRLPEELRQFEPGLRELMTAKLKRGKVEVRAAIESGSATSIVEPTPRLMQRLNSVQDSVKSWLPDAQSLSVADIIKLASSEQSSSRDWSQDVMPLAEKALKSLLTAREREGARLATMLLDRISQLRELARQATPLVPQLVEQQRLRFMERWKEIGRAHV